jgi:TRAP-type C4-dicarboxylate transport system permease small subunit
MPPRIARLAGLGALAACGAVAALFLYVAYISRHTATGGMMPALSVVSWISVGIVVVALIAVHIAIGKQLLYIGRGGGPRQV